MSTTQRQARVLRIAVCLAALPLVTGCGSSDGGGAGASGSGATSASSGTSGGGSLECQETPMAVGTTEVTPLGFSAAELLATLGGTHQSGLAWVAGSALYASHARAGAETSVTFAFNNATASATFVESKGGGCPAQGDGPCVVCQSRLEVALGLDMSTADGALLESMSVTLATSSKTTARFAVDVPAASVMGAYFTGITPKDSGEIAGLHVEAAWGDSFPGSGTVVPDAWNGFVAAQVRPQGSTSGGAFVAHGYFPPETVP